MATVHKPVLLGEIIKYLKPKAGETAIDGTVGGGGHAVALSNKLGELGRILILDADAQALQHAEAALADQPAKVLASRQNFRHLDQAAKEHGLNQVNMILLDLGMSSDQLEQSGRGFSFQKNEPLLMTYKDDPGPEDLTAETIVNTWREENLADVIYGFGGERFARRIAAAIAEFRQKESIRTTDQLVRIIESAVPRWYARARLHGATRTFQALRIAVNDELGALKAGLDVGWGLLAPKGRLGVITFQSLEGRIVKKFYQEKAKAGEGQIIKPAAIKPSREEQLANPRARSAVLRAIQKIS